MTQPCFFLLFLSTLRCVYTAIVSFLLSCSNIGYSDSNRNMRDKHPSPRSLLCKKMPACAVINTLVGMQGCDDGGSFSWAATIVSVSNGMEVDESDCGRDQDCGNSKGKGCPYRGRLRRKVWSWSRTFNSPIYNSSFHLLPYFTLLFSILFLFNFLSSYIFLLISISGWLMFLVTKRSVLRSSQFSFSDIPSSFSSTYFFFEFQS